MSDAFDKIKFDSNGLIPAVIQDESDGQVLALYYMNRAAIEKTIETGKVHSFSRSRNRLALKGESSGHIETVKSIKLDCDGDTLVIEVDQVGGACHEGYRSCFFREFKDGSWKIIAEKVFDPEAVYKK